MAHLNRPSFGRVEERWTAISLVVLMKNQQGQSMVLESETLADLQVRHEWEDTQFDVMSRDRVYVPHDVNCKLTVLFRQYSLTVRDVQKVEYRKDGPTGIYLPTASFSVGADAAAFIEIGG